MVPTDIKNDTSKTGPELPGILVIFSILGDNNSDYCYKAVYAIVELERSFRGWKRLKAIGEFPQFAHT